MLELKNFEIDMDGRRRLKADLALPAGQALRLGGKSGGGKTTLLKAMALLIPRLSGDIFLLGKESKEYPPYRWRRQVSYLAQKPTMIPGTVEDNLRVPFSLKVSGKDGFLCEHCGALLETIGLDQDTLHRDAAVISGGEASRVAVLRAILAEPKVILADEITAPLDEENALKVIAALKEWLKGGDRALLFVAHQEQVWNGLAAGEVMVDRFLNDKG